MEIPGDVQSTCGSESSHEHFPGDLSFDRGYEYRLMYEARKRNPDIRIYGLEWSVPGWVGGKGSIHTAADDYSAANRQYTIDWLVGARERWNISTVDFLGFWVPCLDLVLAKLRHCMSSFHSSLTYMCLRHRMNPAH